MRFDRFAIVVAVALIATCLASSPASAQAREATLPGRCFDQRIEPTSVILSCADAGFVAEDLVWADWGSERATASGTASVKTCDPDCATGGREDYPVELVADRLRACPYGAPQYTRVTYSFQEESPFPRDSPGAEDPTVGFSCPKRPHANPRINSMRLRLTGHNPGPRYFVRVHVRLRVCAVRGRSEVVFNEQLRLGGEAFGEHSRTLRFRQRARCQWQSFRWKLRDEFFGVGTYVVRATVWDKDSQSSRTVSRRVTTVD